MGWMTEELGVVLVAFVEMFPCCGAPRPACFFPASSAVDPGAVSSGIRQQGHEANQFLQ